MKQVTTKGYRFDPPIQAVENCRKIKRLALYSILLCAVGQLFIDASASNVISVLIVAATSTATFHFVINGSVFRTLPLPALVVLGFNISTMSGALIAQTLSLRSLVYNLQVPQITFLLCALFQVSLLVALFVFLGSSTLRSGARTINRRVFVRMGIMQAPSPRQLWIMGLVGCTALLWSALGTSGNVAQYGDVGDKLIAGLAYLAFAPFVIPVLNKIFPSSPESATSKKSTWLLLGYFLVLVVIGVARNSRSILVFGIANLGVAGLLLLLLGQLRVTAGLRRSFAIGSVVVLIAAPTLADLAIAMEVARGQRSEVSATTLVALTIEVFNDKAELETYRKVGAALVGTGDYEENYLANPCLARFVNIKFFDNTLSYEDVRTGARSDQLWAISLDKVVALLPTPVLVLLGTGISKQNLDFSMGDALLNAQTGAALGGYVTGSTVGHGMALMGPLMFIAVVPLFLLVFMAVQSLTRSVGSFVTISPLILLQLMSVFGLPAADSLLDTISFMLRTLPQNILLYWIIFNATRWVSKSRQRRRQPGSVRIRSPDLGMRPMSDPNPTVTRSISP